MRLTRMIPALLITFRETIEATLIVVTILGLLYRLKLTRSIYISLVSIFCAILSTVLLFVLSGFIGLRVQEWYVGYVEEIVEGSLMILSAFLITWAVFFLHTFFAHHKVILLQKVQGTVSAGSRKALFFLVFTAIFREGFEIVLFLSSLYLSDTLQSIGLGALFGILLGILFSIGIFRATIRIPLYIAFRASSLLLILFSAGLLARGIHAFTEIGYVPQLLTISLPFLPSAEHFVGEVIKALFGLTQQMDMNQLIPYYVYTSAMVWWVFIRKSIHKLA